MFEFLEHHVEGYYCDVDAKISQTNSDLLTQLQSPYLPYDVPLQELLQHALYQGPIIKHSLIHLVVSGMSCEEPTLFRLLPEEFTTLPRAIRRQAAEARKQPCK